MKHNLSLAVVFIAVFLQFCKPEVRKVELFDVRSLVKIQKDLYHEAGVKVTRISVLNEITDTTVFDSYQWTDELSTLESMDLNSSRFKTDYKKEITQKDGYSCLSYSLDKPLENFTGIYRFDITYSEDMYQPKRIEILESSSNLVYSSRNNYILEFEEKKGKSYLKGFYVKGGHDLMLKQPISYEVFTSVAL